MDTHVVPHGYLDAAGADGVGAKNVLPRLFKQFMDNDSFRRWMTDTVFGLTYEPCGRQA